VRVDGRDGGYAAFNQSGGELTSGEVRISENSVFDFTGGQIHAPITNNGIFKAADTDITFEYLFFQ